MALEISPESGFSVPHTPLSEGKAASKLQISELPNFTCHCYLKERNAFFTGQENGQILMWIKDRESIPEIVDGHVVPDLRLPAHAGTVTCMVWHPHYKLLITGSVDRFVKLFDPFTGKIADPSQRCIQSLAAHENAVTAMTVFSNLLITAGNDRTIRIWKNDEGREFLMYPLLTCLQVFSDLPGWITGIVAAPQPRGGDYPDIVAGDWEGNLVLLKCSDTIRTAAVIEEALSLDHRPMTSFSPTRPTAPPAVSFSPIASGVRSSGVPPTPRSGLRSAPPGPRPPLPPPTPSARFRSRDTTPNDSFTFEVLKIHKKYHQQAITKALYLWEDGTVITISFDNTARISDVRTLGSTTTIKNPRGVRYVSMDWNPEDEEVWFIDSAGYLDVYRFSAHKVILTQKLENHPTYGTYVPSKDLFVISHRHGNNFYKVFRSIPYREYHGHEGAVIGIEYLEPQPGVGTEEAYVASVGQDNLVIVWNCYDFALTPIQRFPMRDSPEITAFAVTPSERIIVTGHDDGTMRMIVVDTERIIAMQSKGLGHRNTVSAMAMGSHTIYRGTEAEDSPHVITGDYDGYAATWDLRHKKPFQPGLLTKWRAHDTEILAVAYSNQLNVHVTAGNDKLIKIWTQRGPSHSSPEPLCVLRGHTDAITSLTFDGNILISGSHDRTIRMWNGVAWEHLTTLTKSSCGDDEDCSAHCSEVTALRIAPLAGMLISASRDGTVRLWDCAKNKLVHTYERRVEFMSLATEKRGTDIFAGTDSGVILRFSRKPDHDLDLGKKKAAY